MKPFWQFRRQGRERENKSSNGPARLAAGRDRLCKPLARLTVYSERELELLPNRNQGVSQLLDRGVASEATLELDPSLVQQ